MNARDYKTFHTNGYYHIFNRGDNKEPIFLDEQDFFNFIKRLKIVLGLAPVPNAGHRGALQLRALPANNFDILAYCLMQNHFHFLIKQLSNINVSQLISKVCISYAKYFNKKYERVGNLFQDTFKAKEILDDSYLKYVSAYIHNNPENPLTYQYSSLSEYLKKFPNGVCNTKFILNYFNGNRTHYKDFVLGYSEDQDMLIKDLIFEE